MYPGVPPVGLDEADPVQGVPPQATDVPETFASKRAGSLMVKFCVVVHPLLSVQITE